MKQQRVYLVEEYPPSGDFSAWRVVGRARTLSRARAIVRHQIGVSRLDPRILWRPPASWGSDIVEAYHRYPRTHPQGYRCGGYVVRQVERLRLG
jgi:hypothetical protein